VPLFSLFTERRNVAEDFRTIYDEAPDILRPVLSIRPKNRAPTRYKRQR
jgi:hypothetical protein